MILAIDITEAERFCAPELSKEIDPLIAFDLSWGRTLRALAIERMRAEHRIMNKSALFDAILPRLDGAAPMEHEAIGTRLGGRYPGATHDAACSCGTHGAGGSRHSMPTSAECCIVT